MDSVLTGFVFLASLVALAAVAVAAVVAAAVAAHFVGARNGSQRLHAAVGGYLRRLHLEQLAVERLADVVLGEALHDARVPLLDRPDEQFGALDADVAVVPQPQAVDQPADRGLRPAAGDTLDLEALPFVGDVHEGAANDGRRLQHLQYDRLSEAGRVAVIQSTDVLVAVFGLRVHDLQAVAEHGGSVVGDRRVRPAPDRLRQRRSDARTLEDGRFASHDRHSGRGRNEERRRTGHLLHANHVLLRQAHLRRQQRIPRRAGVRARVLRPHRLQNQHSVRKLRLGQRLSISAEEIEN